MRLPLPLLAALSLLASSLARADVRKTVGLDYQRADHLLPDEWSAYPGPFVAIDAWGQRGFGFHGAFHVGFSQYRDTHGNRPCCTDQVDFLMELHAMYAARTEDVTFIASAGLNLVGKREYYRSEGSTHGDSSPSVGLGASLGVDLADTSRGTVQLVGGVSMFSIPQAIGLCSGELSCHRQVWTFSLGVGLSR